MSPLCWRKKSFMIYWKNKNNKETYMKERTSRREIKYKEKTEYILFIS